MATSAVPTAALRQRRRQCQGQLGWAGAGEAEGTPCTSSSSLLVTGPRTQAPVLRVTGAAAPQLRRRRRRTRSQRGAQPAGVASAALRPSSEASAAAAGAGAGAPHSRRPRWGGGLGAGRRGPPSWARSPSAAPGVAEPPPPPPASKFGGSEPDASRDPGAFVFYLPLAPFGGDPREQCRWMCF